MNFGPVPIISTSVSDESSQDALIADLQEDKADKSELISLSTLDARYKMQEGRLFVPPAYMQTSGDAAFKINSAALGMAFGFPVEADYALPAISAYVTALVTEGNINIKLCADGTAYEPNGKYNGSTKNLAPTMTANNAPAPNVAGLFDSAGANAEAGAGYEAFKAYDNVTTADNGTRSNAAPTGVAPIYLTLDLGEGNGIRLNRFSFFSFNNADANVRAFPKAFTAWGSNNAAPAPQTDANWTQLTGEVAWTAETDPGAGLARSYYVSNSISYRHIRFAITDRTGANAYVALGGVQLFGAQLESAPGTELLDIGSLGSGAAADAWVQKALATAYQMQRGTFLWLKFMGSAGADYSLSKRRWHNSNGTMFPDGCVTKETSTTGDAWTQAEQNGKPALMNIVLCPTTHHAPKLYYGRHDGQYIYIPGTGLVTIPEAGVSLDCEGLTASVDHNTYTLYNVYLNYAASTLTLSAATTEPIRSSGLDVKSTDSAYLWIGAMCARNWVSTYQGPVDTLDLPWLAWRGRKRSIAKGNPNYSLTQESLTFLFAPWQSGAYTVICLALTGTEITTYLCPGSQTNAQLRETTLLVDGRRAVDETQQSNTATSSSTEVLVVKTSLRKGLRTITPASRSQSVVSNINHWRSAHADGTMGFGSTFKGEIQH